MDQLMVASLSHSHYWYEVGTLKVSAVDSSGSTGRLWKGFRMKPQGVFVGVGVRW